MSLSGAQVAQHYELQVATLAVLIASHHQLAGQIRSASDDIDRELAAARRELAAVYLPALTDEALARAARLTGFMGFSRRDPRIALVHERRALEAALAELEADDRFVRRADLARELAAELDGARAALAPLDAACARFEALPGFAELVASGYGTPDLTEGWWQPGYGRLRTAAEKIGFDDARPVYRRAAAPRDAARAACEAIEQRLDGLHGLVRRRDLVAGRLARLDATVLAQAQDFLGEHLEHADGVLLEDWARHEPDVARAVQLGVRRLAGVAAKRKFVGEIAQSGVPGIVADLEDRRGRAHDKAEKYARPKYAAAAFDGALETVDADEIGAQRDKIKRRVDAVAGHRDYAAFDLAQDEELWWWHMTGAPPPPYCPRLYAYYQAHPEAMPRVTPDEDRARRAVAAAFVAGDLERDGYLS